MGYIGKVPADVLIDPHVDSASIVDSTIVTADIANDAVTSAKLAENSVDSSELIDGSVDNSHLAGSIAINKTLLTAGTGLTLSTNTLSVDAAQSQITSVGTLTGLTTGAITQNAGTLTIKNASSDSNGLKIYQDSGDASKIYNHYNGTLQLGVGSTTAITIDSSENTTFAGDVNVTSDGARFFVSSADYELVSIGRAGSSGSALDQGYLRMKSAGSNKIAFHTAGNSYINGGSLGIGTDSPGYLTELRVNDTTVDTPRLVIRQLGTGDSSLAFQLPNSPYGWVMGADNSDSDRFKISTGVADLDSSPRFEIDPGGTTIHRYTGAENTVQIHSGTGSSTTGVSQIYFSSKDQYGGNTHQSYIKSTIDGSSSTSATKMTFHNRDSGGTVQEYLTISANGIATFSKNIITATESNHTFTASATDNVAIKRQVWYSSYSSHNFQLSTTDSGSNKYLILSTFGSNGHVDWKITGNRMSQVYASITFTNYADASGRTAYLEWSDDEGQNWNTVDTHGSWGAGAATVAATINTSNGSSQTGGSSSGSSSGSNQIIIRARFVGGGGNYIGITNVTIKPTASYWTFVPVPRGYYNTVVSGITASTKSVQGTWTKIGRQIFIQAYLTISGKSGGSGNPYIPLPFTPSDIGVPASTVGANIYKNTSISGLAYFGLYGANKQIYANDGNGGYIGHSSWANGVVGFNLTYNTL